MATKPNFYMATFSDGSVKKRISHRTFTHAWRWTAIHMNTKKACEVYGFASNEGLARSYVSGLQAANWLLNLKTEVVPVVVVK